MNRFPAWIILSVAFLGKFVITGASAQSVPEDAVSSLMAAWNLKDAHAFASQFTEDATFVNVNGAQLPFFMSTISDSKLPTTTRR